MKATLLLLTTLLFSSFSSATIMVASDNPAVAPGPAIYMGDFPTPHQDPLVFDSPDSLFRVNEADPVRAAVSLDLQLLDPISDEGTGAFDNGLLDVTFSLWMGGTEQLFFYVPYLWTDVEALQSSGFGLLSFWSEEFMLTAGDWSLFGFAEQQYLGGVGFQVVPEPAPMALFALMLSALLLRRKSGSVNR